jgi:hypothetical protein
MKREGWKERGRKKERKKGWRECFIRQLKITRLREDYLLHKTVKVGKWVAGKVPHLGTLLLR